MEQNPANSDLFLQEHINGLQQSLLKECVAMMQFALHHGMLVEQSIVEAITDSAKQPNTADTRPPLEELVKAHNQLSTLIAPVTPNTLPAERQYYGKTGIPKLNITGQLIGLSLFFMFVFIISSLPASIDDNIGKDFTQIDGPALLTYLILLLSIAGLGASFAALFQVNWLIKKHTFDPSQGATYYVQILLGIIAGLFISQLIDVSSGNGTLTLLSKPTLALLGGFSSTAVYRILRQLLTALEALVKGDAEEMITSQQQLLHTEAQQLIQAGRVKVATELLPLRNQLPEQWQTKFDEQIELLLGYPISKSQPLNEPSKPG